MKELLSDRPSQVEGIWRYGISIGTETHKLKELEDIFEKVYEALKNFGELVLNTERAA